MGREGDRAAFAKYSRLVAIWSEDPNAGGEVDESDYLLADLIADFMESADSPRTAHRSRYKQLAKLLGESGGEVKVSDFGPVAFRGWVTWLSGLKGPKGSRFNRKTIGHYMGALRRVVKWGVSTERIESGQLEALATVPGPRAGQVRASKAGRMASADPRAVEKLLPFLSGPVRAMVEVQVLTGARPSELCRMKVGEVIRSGRLDLPGVGLVELGDVWVYLPVEHKTSGQGKERWLIFGPKAQAVLRPLLARRRDGDHVFDPRKADRRRGRTGYGRAPGRCYSADTYAQAIERACDRAGVGRITPYSLRRLASREIDAAFGREATAATLGHAHPDTSAIYTGRNFKRAVEVARARG